MCVCVCTCVVCVCARVWCVCTCVYVCACVVCVIIVLGVWLCVCVERVCIYDCSCGSSKVHPTFSQIEFLNSVIADLQRKLETAETLVGLHGPLEGVE